MRPQIYSHVYMIVVYNILVLESPHAHTHTCIYPAYILQSGGVLHLCLLLATLWQHYNICIAK